MELSLVDYEMCHIPPSRLAAGALCLSIKLLENADWVCCCLSYAINSSSCWSSLLFRFSVSHFATLQPILQIGIGSCSVPSCQEFELGFNEHLSASSQIKILQSTFDENFSGNSTTHAKLFNCSALRF